MAAVISEMLYGRNSFYKKITTEEMVVSKPLDPIYVYNTGNKVFRVVSNILFFPFSFIHGLVGKLVLPSSSECISSLNQMRKNVFLENNGWKYKRIAIKVDDLAVDAMLMVNPSNPEKKSKWALISNGNRETYESKLDDSSLKRVLCRTRSNALLFNYPGVGASAGVGANLLGVNCGLPSRSATSKAYRALLKFLEDEEKGIGAKKIWGWGFSIGGGFQGDALRGFNKFRNCGYTFVKDRSFSDVSSVVPGLSWLIKLLGWNIRSVESSIALKAPEIIMQTANVSFCGDIFEHEIIYDDVISKEASCAAALLRRGKESFAGEKAFLGISEKHNSSLRDSTVISLSDKINYYCR